jgi:hypothetical protein
MGQEVVLRLGDEFLEGLDGFLLGELRPEPWVAVLVLGIDLKVQEEPEQGKNEAKGPW